MSTKITVTLENVTDESIREVIEELSNGEFSYEASVDWIDGNTAKIALHAGEYAVVMDELLTEKQDELLDPDATEFPYRSMYEDLPKTVNVSEGDHKTVESTLQTPQN